MGAGKIGLDGPGVLSVSNLELMVKMPAVLGGLIGDYLPENRELLVSFCV